MYIYIYIIGCPAGIPKPNPHKSHIGAKSPVQPKPEPNKSNPNFNFGQTKQFWF